MADIRINALATTAASTASDDFLAVDGSANGTRKLNAYSPTFGGNLTVSGTGGLILSSATPTISSSATNASLSYTANGTGNHLFNNAVNVNGVNGVGKLNVRVDTDANAHFRPGTAVGDGTAVFIDSLNDANNAVAGLTLRGSTVKIRDGSGVNATFTGGNATLSGNLTVSGGTITGGTSGMSLASGGTNQNITLTPSGTGLVRVTCSRATAYSSSLTGDVVIYNPDQTDNGYSSLAFGTRTSAGGVVDTGSVIASITTNHIGASFATQLAFLTRNGSGTLVEAGRFTNGGNFLIGTTTDGGQKLQVSGDAAFAGDRVINRKDQNAVTRLQVRNDTSGTAGQAQISATVGDFTTYTAFGQLSAGFTSTGLYQANSGYFVGSNALYIFTASASSLVLGTNNTTALTLDTSQRCILAGALRLANTYVATPQVSTGYVTIQDSTGTTYKVLVAT